MRGPFRTDQRARAAYAEAAGIYRIVPEAVAVPADLDDLGALVEWAGTHRVGLVPRGAGSGMPGGNVGPGVVVDLTQLEPRTLTVDPAAHLAVASASFPYAELTAAAGRHGLRLPPDPSSGAWATLGGMVATNAAGARSLRHGPVRPWVNGVHLMTADGAHGWLRRGMSPGAAGWFATVEQFEAGVAPALRDAAPLIRRRYPKTRKNTAGYALDAFVDSDEVVDLIVGSEGTLGIITAIEWQLAPVPVHRALLAVVLDDLESLSEVVAALGACDPSTLELLDRSFLDLLREDPGLAAPTTHGLVEAAEALLLVEFEHDRLSALRGRVGDAVRQVSPLVAQVETALTEDEVARLWSVRHAASPILARLPEHRRSLQVIEDGCVPVECLSRYTHVIREAATKLGLQVVLFGHAGDGHLHVNLLADTSRSDWVADVETLRRRVTDAVLELGGTPSGEHGDGRLRAGTLERLYGREILDLFWLVKRTFDPLGIMNPGVVLTEDGEALTQLKVGQMAARLPPDIAAALRRLERDAAYGRWRLTLAEGSGAS